MITTANIILRFLRAAQTNKVLMYGPIVLGTIALVLLDRPWDIAIWGLLIMLSSLARGYSIGRVDKPPRNRGP